MKNIQFCHQNAISKPSLFILGSYTVAVDVPSLEQMLSQKVGTFCDINVGVARVSEKETHFIKKVGREVSLSKMTPTQFQLTCIRLNEYSKTIDYIFESANDITLYFSVKEGRSKVHFVNASKGD